jgi:hypothetical protein
MVTDEGTRRGIRPVLEDGEKKDVPGLNPEDVWALI